MAADGREGGSSLGWLGGGGRGEGQGLSNDPKLKSSSQMQFSSYYHWRRSVGDRGTSATRWSRTKQKKKRSRQDSNQQSLPPEGSALSIERVRVNHSPRDLSSATRASETDRRKYTYSQHIPECPCQIGVSGGAAPYHRSCPHYNLTQPSLSPAPCAAPLSPGTCSCYAACT